MISIIICSRTKSLNDTLISNIAATIGAEYELIAIDNSENKYSIFEAYNIGVSQSQYPCLCFMHDDITYHSNNWGAAVINHFADDDTTALGVAGSPYFPVMPAPWWGSGVVYANLYSPAAANQQPSVSEKKEVIVFDGLWFCIKKSAFNHIKFDSSTFKGFHLYDIDICMQMLATGLKMFCVNDVVIEHNSFGKVNTAWINDELTLQKKWKTQLPASSVKYSKNDSCRFEFKALNCFIWICYDNGYTNRKTYGLALKYLSQFTRGYFFYKTSGYLVKFLFKYLFKKGEPFYS